MAASGKHLPLFLPVFLALTLLMLGSSHGSLLPLLDHHPGNWLRDLWLDPFRILEHDPYGIERDQQRSFSASPAMVDWKETQDGQRLMIELPGLKKEDVKIEVDEKIKGPRVVSIAGGEEGPQNLKSKL